jgi:hypothetical protein
MDRLKILQLKKLLKELDFIESDFDYRSEIISDADREFIDCINNFLSENPELKEVYEKKVEESIEKSIKKFEETDILVIEEEETTTDTEGVDTDTEGVETEEEIKEKINNKEIKKIYREIVKLTHPDRVKKKNLNDLYIKATEYYDNNNKIGLYKICTELGIEFQLIDEDENYINQKITELRQKINFIESTFTWKWFNSQNDEEKNQILMNYIKLRIK